MLEGVVIPMLLVTSSPKRVLSCLWEASWRCLHTTGYFCKAAQPDLVLTSLLLLLPLVVGLAAVSMVVVSVGGRFTVPTQVGGFLAAGLVVVVVRMEGFVLVDGGL